MSDNDVLSCIKLIFDLENNNNGLDDIWMIASKNWIEKFWENK